MLGFAIGTVCLVGLVVMARRRHWAHGHGDWHHGRHAHHGCAGDEGGPGFGHRRARRGWFGGFGMKGFVVDRIADRVDATPDQEKVLEEAVEEVARALRQAKNEVRATRSEAADVVRAETFDAERATAIFERHDVALAEVRRVLIGAAAKVHATLEPKQREALGDLVAKGGGWRGGGPYRV